MYLKYEGAHFRVGLNASIERHLIKQAIKKRIGKLIGKPYQFDPYLTFANKLLANSSNSTIVDIGANIGTTVLPLAVKYPHARFYAIEPHPMPAARLITNCERSGVHNVNILTVAVGLEAKMTQIYTCPTNSGGHRLTGFKGRKDLEQFSPFGPITVPIKPLNEIFLEFGITNCTLLKIDVEGFEVLVLKSLKDKLIPNNVNYIVAELGTEGLRLTGYTSWDLISLMQNRGYVCRILGTDKIIEHEEQVPIIPDFTVLDVLFSAA